MTYLWSERCGCDDEMFAENGNIASSARLGKRGSESNISSSIWKYFTGTDPGAKVDEAFQIICNLFMKSSFAIQQQSLLNLNTNTKTMALESLIRQLFHIQAVYRVHEYSFECKIY